MLTVADGEHNGFVQAVGGDCTDTEFTEILGQPFVNAFTTYKRDEIERFNAWITDWEFNEYTYHL